MELLDSCAATGRHEVAAALRTEDGGARVVTPSASVASAGGGYAGNGFWPDVAIAQLTTSYGIAVLVAPISPLVEPTRNSL